MDMPESDYGEAQPAWKELDGLLLELRNERSNSPDIIDIDGVQSVLPQGLRCIESMNGGTVCRGIWTTNLISKETTFGPLPHSEFMNSNESSKSTTPCDDQRWMTLVYCKTTEDYHMQNVLAYKHYGKIYFRVLCDIEPGIELVLTYCHCDIYIEKPVILSQNTNQDCPTSDGERLSDSELVSLDKDNVEKILVAGTSKSDENKVVHEISDATNCITPGNVTNTETSEKQSLGQENTCAQNEASTFARVSDSQQSNNACVRDSQQSNKTTTCDMKKASRKGTTKKKPNTAKMKTTKSQDIVIDNSQDESRSKSGQPANYACEKCGCEFTKYGYMKRHIKIQHAGSKEFSCDICQESFGTKYRLKKHMNIHAKDKPNPSPNKHEKKCVDVKKANANEKDLSMSDEKALKQKEEQMSSYPFPCTYCDKQFKIESALELHMRGHTENPFACTTCDFAFTEAGSLRRHVRVVHAGIKPFTCPDCDKTFAAKYQLKRHQLTHSSTKSHSCSVCGKQFSHPSYLKSHENIHKTPEEKAKQQQRKLKLKVYYKCTYCTKRFRSENALDSHVRGHTGAKPFYCAICGKNFSQSNHLHAHMRGHEAAQKRSAIFSDGATSVIPLATVHHHGQYPCNLCGRKFSTEEAMNKHKKIHEDKKSHTCHICGKSFSRLHKHLETHNLNKDHVCSICQKGFHSKSDLSIHMRKHSGDKPYQCPVCLKSFHQTSGLSTHLRRHTGERPYSCTTCDKSFIDAPTLEKHRRIHTGDKPFLCTTCGKRFTQFAQLYTHRITHSNVRPFGCEVCGKLFKIQKILDEHMRIHTGVKPFACSTCGKRFTQRSTRMRHTRTCSSNSDSLKTNPFNIPGLNMY